MAANPTTSAHPAVAQSQSSLSGRIPPWGQILVILAPWPIIKSIPGVPFSGQLYIFVALITATWFVRQDGQTWRDLGLRWASSWQDYAKGAAMVVVTIVAAVVASAAVQYAILAVTGAPAERTFYDVSTLPLYLTMMALIWTTNAFGEEMVFRGLIMSRFATMFGGTRIGWILAAFAQAAVFGAGHAGQGIHGVIITGFVGLAFGLLYLIARRNLWPMIIAHGIINTIGMTVLHLQSTGVIAAGNPIG
ncbi:MAG: type II CAAX endopeptidase family protein [Pseudomonadota bacterium]